MTEKITPQPQPHKPSYAALVDNICALEEEVRLLSMMARHAKQTEGEQTLAEASARIAELEKEGGRTLVKANARIAELEKELQDRDIPSSPAVVGEATSSLPLKSELEVILVFLCEVMKPRQLSATFPVCDKTSDLAKTDCVALARGFDFLSKTSGSNEDAVGKYLDNFPVMRDMHNRTRC